MNNRLKEINDFVDNTFPNNSINNLIEKYSDQLYDYNYIKTVDDFSILPCKGSLKYINKYDKQLRNGGLCVKIFKKDDDWIAIIKKINNKKYYVSFKKNYIFYLKNRSDLIKDWAEYFVSQY